jgi:hypothetical protein
MSRLAHPAISKQFFMYSIFKGLINGAKSAARALPPVSMQ